MFTPKQKISNFNPTNSGNYTSGNKQFKKHLPCVILDIFPEKNGYGSLLIQELIFDPDSSVESDVGSAKGKRNLPLQFNNYSKGRKYIARFKKELVDRKIKSLDEAPDIVDKQGNSVSAWTEFRKGTNVPLIDEHFKSNANFRLKPVPPVVILDTVSFGKKEKVNDEECATCEMEYLIPLGPYNPKTLSRIYSGLFTCIGTTYTHEEKVQNRTEFFQWEKDGIWVGEQTERVEKLFAELDSIYERSKVYYNTLQEAKKTENWSKLNELTEPLRKGIVFAVFEERGEKEVAVYDAGKEVAKEKRKQYALLESTNLFYSLEEVEGVDEEGREQKVYLPLNSENVTSIAEEFEQYVTAQYVEKQGISADKIRIEMFVTTVFRGDRRSSRIANRLSSAPKNSPIDHFVNRAVKISQEESEAALAYGFMATNTILILKEDYTFEDPITSEQVIRYSDNVRNFLIAPNAYPRNVFSKLTLSNGGVITIPDNLKTKEELEMLKRFENKDDAQSNEEAGAINDIFEDDAL